MIDIQLLRNDTDAVAKRLTARGFTLDVAGFTALEDARRKIQVATEGLQSERNAKSKQIGQAKAARDQKRVDEIMAEVAGYGDR
ncbi:MAG: serine--tRNA ligase, partial [Proteobacteria bacterium]|nr:serine--tRNA ligase [Pseudomonadota bacterium]